MSGDIWVYVDHFKGVAHPGSWEAIGAARKLAAELDGQVTALVFGESVRSLAEEAIQFGANEVLMAEDPTLAVYRSDPFVSLLSAVASDSDPAAILFPTTTRGREIAGMAAIDLDTGVIPDVVALEIENGRILATRPVYAGKVLSKAVCSSDPQIVTLRVRAFEKPVADSSRAGEIRTLSPVKSEDQIAVKVISQGAQEAGAVSLTEANVIVSGGRGVANNPGLMSPAEITDPKDQEIWRAQEGFKMIGELVRVLGAAMGASRAAVDAGYIPYDHQVGQTGKVVSPDLYIACGISGAIQHQAGMRTS